MGGRDPVRLEVALNRYYASQHERVNPHTIDLLARAMVAEDERTMPSVPSVRMGPISFIGAQVRYIPAWTWVAQVGLVALMWAVARTAGDPTMIKVAVGILSAMTVTVAIPTVHASKRYGVAELEYSCPNNAAHVMVARLIILGCSSSLAVALMVGATAASLDASVFVVALWSVPPFFLSCTGALTILRKAAPTTAPLLCVAWSAACSAALLSLASVVSDLYTQASLTMWATAAAIACAWLVREVAMTCRAVMAGLDAFSPHLTRTYD